MTDTNGATTGAVTPDEAADNERQLRALDYDTTTIEAIQNAGITLRNVTKRYGTSTVVDDIDLEIEAGEFMTLLGPSGSGKTTTLNMIAGFTDVTEGDLFIYGKPVAKLPANKRDIGVVFQNYALFPHMTVGDNVAYPLKRRKIAKAERDQRVTEALGMVRLSQYVDRLPGELSGGQQQRVALARALVYHPRVLLMDEPLGALDKKLREWLQLEIKRIHHQVGSTFVFVTHDQEEALSMSDRIAVFNNGKIEQVGTGVELYEHPATMFVGRFLGESTVFHGDAEATSDGGTALVSGGNRIVAPGRIDAATQGILVRPENLVLEPVDAARESTARNAIPVEIATSTYLGVGWRYDVTLPSGRKGIVRSPHTATRFDIGDKALMTWEPDRGVLLEDTGDADETAT